MFDIGFMELAVIALVAVVVLGPDRLPDLARQAAQLLHRARGLAHNARDELRSELGPEYSDLQLRDLDPRTIVRKHITEAMAEVDREEAERAARASTLPDGQVPPYDVEAT
ncbi:sec-independent translocase [Nocardioides okcheonensis]|uniref:sec-independent translocase n=1 Tax=Nocardioides okcheonensis TaxID=2894081 RepID=UPI001E466370|nr:sec-independent translocase [Nocardioides okcheonensis]UFN44105.1 Sec-independent protein translocase protein TatB [Nocardioides okcheonensis]